MPTEAISGHTGTSSQGTEITSWELNLSQEALEATSMASSGNREYVAGLSGGNGKIEGVGTAPTKGAVSSLQLANDNDTFSGDAIISNVQHLTPVDNVVRWTCDFVYTGTITIS